MISNRMKMRMIDDGVKEDDAGVFGGESESARFPRTSTWRSSHSSQV